MRKALRALLALAVAVGCVFGFGGCSKKSEEGRSSYSIVASLNADEATLAAVCTIDYLNRTEVELEEIKFHLYPAAYRDGAKFAPVTPENVEGVYPAGISYGGITINEVTGGTWQVAGQDEDILCVTLPEKLQPTHRARIVVDYTLRIPHIRHRFGYDNGTFNLGNFFPIECAYSGGFVESPYYSCGDPFNFGLYDFDFSVTAPKSLTAACPAPATRTEDGETATTRCSLRNARDFAVVLGAFECKSAKAGNVDVHYYYTADPQADLHLQAAVDAINFFSRSFGAYPYSSFSAVQTPFNQGGMEYSGLVYVSDAAQNKMITEVIVHEAAHQWWYGLVGNDQIENAWQDETLAEYSTTLFYDAHPDYGVTYADRIADAMSSLSLYSEIRKAADTSMLRPLSAFDNETEYTFCVYVKGQLLMDTLKNVVGKDALLSGLRRYATVCANTTAHPDDFIAALEKASGRELKGLVESFLDGSAKLYASI